MERRGREKDRGNGKFGMKFYGHPNFGIKPHKWNKLGMRLRSRLCW